MEQTSRLEIDLSAVERNVATVRRACAGGGGQQVGVCAVLKADGYGLGAVRVAKRLELAAADMVAVFTLEQARAICEANVRLPVLVLMPVRTIRRTDSLYLPLSQGRLHLTVHDEAQLEALAKHADHLGTTLPVHVEVNTGINRGGARPEEAERLVRRIASHARLALAGVYTHFASADCDAAMTARQHDVFSAWLARVKDCVPATCVAHQANSFATFRSAGLHRDMVRVGLALLGYCGEELADAGSCALGERARELAPAVRWLSEVVHVSRVPAGETVGYGGTWRAARETRLALAPVGYADGYPLALSNKGVVGVTIDGGDGHPSVKGFCPVVGRVSMDQIAIDVTEMPGGVKVGAEVEVYGADPSAPNYLARMAKAAGTITHELLCRISPRVTRAHLAVEGQRETAARVAGGSPSAAVGRR